MKILQPELGGTGSIQAKKAGKASVSQPAGGKKGNESNAVSQQDKVNISQVGPQMKAIRAHLDEIPDVRTEKVSALKDAIDSGQYHPSAENIADALIQAVTRSG
jgi:negative regulator of flagellin synthesis FlgM